MTLKTRLQIPLSLIVLSFILLISGPAWAISLDDFDQYQGTIEIAGGTAHIPVMNEAAQRIMTRNSGIRISVAGGGTGIGVQKAGEGLVDIGNTGRALSQEEINRFGLKSFPFAIDGVAPVIHPSNPVSGLSAEQIRAVFSGEITNWKEVGGRDARINLYGREEASGTHDVFWKRLLDRGDIALTANIVQSNGAMKVAVSNDANSIGYMSIGHIDDSIKPLEVDGVLPSQETAIDGSYSVVRLLYMNTKGDPSTLVKAFIDYIYSDDGAEIIRAAGYIPTK
ncbi:phosphate ABC transporter substrate-binding protein [Desulfonatronovibrio hydrogenovorans]|uniref:phosphate ABC transporter substrate-binding protein n=1 Tax=Desulfonatronovibrio hydrogenovorans TaxID=53245 RepID=UPI00048A7A08